MTKSTHEDLFDLLVEFAREGKRCPTNDELEYAGFSQLKDKNVAALARKGLVRIEIYSRNWRVVTILTGEHKGAATKMPRPMASGKVLKPYRIIDAKGDSCERRGKSPPVTIDMPDWLTK